MPFEIELGERRYDECIECVFIGNGCDGPNLTAIEIPRFCEWCRKLRDKRGYTNAKVAEISGVSLRTIERVMSGTAPGMNSDTKSDIACALVYGKRRDGSWGKNPCAMVALGLAYGTDIVKIAENHKELQEECADLKNRLAKAEKDGDNSVVTGQLRVSLEEAQRKVNYLTERIDHYEKRDAEKDALLRDRHGYLKTKDFYIRLFLSAFGVSMLGNIALLVWIVAKLV